MTVPYMERHERERYYTELLEQAQTHAESQEAMWAANRAELAALVGRKR